MFLSVALDLVLVDEFGVLLTAGVAIHQPGSRLTANLALQGLFRLLD
jgi:hypothetical protein